MIERVSGHTVRQAGRSPLLFRMRCRRVSPSCSRLSNPSLVRLLIRQMPVFLLLALSSRQEMIVISTSPSPSYEQAGRQASERVSKHLANQPTEPHADPRGILGRRRRSRRGVFYLA